MTRADPRKCGPGVTCPIGLRARLTCANRAWVVDPCPNDIHVSIRHAFKSVPHKHMSIGHGQNLCPIDTCQCGTPVNRVRYTGTHVCIQKSPSLPECSICEENNAVPQGQREICHRAVRWNNGAMNFGGTDAKSFAQWHVLYE